MIEKNSEFDIFLDAIAFVIVSVNRQKKWKANLPRIAAVGESLGVTQPDLEPGGKYFDEICHRIAKLGLETGGHDVAAGAELLAETWFGPAGELAPNFMLK
jgi:hypothetical protein